MNGFGQAKAIIIRAILANPKASQGEIAQITGLGPAHVRSVVNRTGLTLPASPARVAGKARPVRRLPVRLPYAGKSGGADWDDLP